MELTTLLENAIDEKYRFDINLDDRDLGSVKHLHLKEACLDRRILFIETQYIEERTATDHSLGVISEAWFSHHTTLTFCFNNNTHWLECYVFCGLPDHLNPGSWYDCETKLIHLYHNPELRLVSTRGPASTTQLENYVKLHNIEDDFQVISNFAGSLLVPNGFKYFPLFRLFLVIPVADGVEAVAKKH